MPIRWNVQDVAPNPGLFPSNLPTHFVGRYDGGSPPSGFHNVGDWTVDVTTPAIWICSVAGAPGTFVSIVGGDVDNFVASVTAGDATIIIGGTATNPTVARAALTGDATTAVNVLTLATVNASPGTVGDSSHVAQVTVNGKGLVTAASAVAISASAIGAVTSVSNSDGTITVTGTATAPVVSRAAITGDVAVPAASNTATLAMVNASPGMTGDATHTSQIVTNSKGLVTSNTAVAIALNATGDATGTLPGALTLATVNASPGTTGDATHTSQVTVNAKGLVTATTAVAIALTASGDATGTLPGALTLATVNSNVGTFGDATHVAQVTVNAKGLVTAVSNVAISGGGAVTSVSNSDGTLTISPTTGAVVASRAALTGDVTCAGGSNTTVLATVNASPGTTGDGSHTSHITTNAKGLVTANSSTAITGAPGDFAVTGSLTAGAVNNGGNSFYGNIPSNVAIATSTTTIFTTASLSIGLWLLIVTVLFADPTPGNIDVEVVTGTATASFGGATSMTVRAGTSPGSSGSFACVVSVTGAGTLVVQGVGTLGTGSALAATSAQSYAKATGYVAVPLLA